MSEFIISFELATILYVIGLVPLLTFLIVFAYRYAEYFTDKKIVRKLNKSLEINKELISQNNRLLHENLKLRNEINEDIILGDE